MMFTKGVVKRLKRAHTCQSVTDLLQQRAKTTLDDATSLKESLIESHKRLCDSLSSYLVVFLMSLLNLNPLV